MKLEKFLILYIFGFIFLSTNLWSQSYTVDYLTNAVEVKTSSGWDKLDIGAALDNNSVLRVTKGGSIEIVTDQGKITINSNGTYILKDLIKSAKEVSGWGLQKVLTAKLSVITGDQKLNAEAAATGVRAVNVLEGKTPDLYLDYQGYVQWGDYYMLKDNWKEAIKYYKQAKNAAIDNEETFTTCFKLAKAYLANNSYLSAQEELAGLKLAINDINYPGYVIMQGNLYLLNSSFEAANQLFQEYLTKSKQKLLWDHQTICFLASIASRGLKNIIKTREYLLKARDLDPGSDIGKEAAKLIAEF